MTIYGVIFKQFFLICPKFDGKVASQSWKHCIASLLGSEGEREDSQGTLTATPGFLKI